MVNYNPSNVGILGSLFGYPYSLKEADLVLLPVPWDVTVSYGAGTSKGPSAILAASPQLDLSLHDIVEPWRYPCAMLDPSESLEKLSDSLRLPARRIIDQLEKGQEADLEAIQSINQGCQRMVDFVYDTAKHWMDMGKTVGLVGGDHSTPLGLIKALAERESFGILQIDAHMDLREAYEGFTYSHASIMYNAIQLEGVESVSQVGIRDFCEEEEAFRNTFDKNIFTYFDDQVKEDLMAGESWSNWVENIVSRLPAKVYVSFDIDGLIPSLCPNTGTPVPGGLSFESVNYLIRKVVSSGRKIVGFDLCEVSPGDNDWDANVGARVLYRLVTMTGISHGKIKSFFK